MNLSKSLEFFNPTMVRERIHVVGCGSVGSSIAKNLVRLGLTNITLWDFDVVEDKNLANQEFFHHHIGMLKVDALKDILIGINPDVEKGLKLKPKGWQGNQLSGWIFLAVDSIDVRKQIVEMHNGNPFVRGVFDFRTRLTDAQHYAASWDDKLAIRSMLNSMDFTEEEAEESTPVSACGTTLGVYSTVAVISSLGVSNFVNMVKGLPYRKHANCDAFSMVLNAF